MRTLYYGRATKRSCCGEWRRERLNDLLDWDNLAEEIDSLGKNDRRELGSRVQTILRHLIKLMLSPATAPRAGWRRTVVEQRLQLSRLLKDSPSLRPFVSEAIAEELPGARTLATLDLAEVDEPPKADPEGISPSEDQMLGPWMPD